MKVAAVTVALMGLAQARIARRSQNAIGGICFDMGDCLITGYGLVACDRSGDNGSLFGLLGSCVDGKTVKAAPSSSSGGFLSMLGLGKRHGPDDDDDVVVVVAANATVVAPAAVVAPAMAGMAGMNMKRHGPDDDDDVVVVVAANATVVAAPMAGMAGMKN